MCHVYHPQSNGLDERFTQTLQRQLLKFVSDELRNWDLFLDSILFSYRVTCQDSTKHSPFYLVYGRQPRLLPVALDLVIPHKDFSTVHNTKSTDIDTHIKVGIVNGPSISNPSLILAGNDKNSKTSTAQGPEASKNIL